MLNVTVAEVGLQGAGVVALVGQGITTSVPSVWLEVRVLPGPPHNKINHLADILAAVATGIGGRL
jgi:hypothetical protein